MEKFKGNDQQYANHLVEAIEVISRLKFSWNILLKHLFNIIIVYNIFVYKHSVTWRIRWIMRGFDNHKLCFDGHFSVVHWKPCQPCRMDVFAGTGNGWNPLVTFTKIAS